MQKTYIPQKQLERLKNLACPGVVVVIYGPRRVGKTTLVNEYLKGVKEKYLSVNGDDVTVQEYLSSQSVEKLKSFIGEHRLLVIDEAQYIENIGVNLKLIADHIPGVKIIATGSSTFDLAKKVGEPLTGRKFTLRMFPLAQLELQAREQPHETKARQESRLIYGSYPAVVTSATDAEREMLLNETVDSYLLKDILELEGLKNRKKVRSLLELLAHQIGKDVSFTELGSQLAMSKNTVERYIDLLEQVFVIIGVRGFSRNLRKEISKNQRYYFCDVGIRNALIRNFNPLRLRSDTGALWENYLFMERMKKREYENISSNTYFWRTYTQQEIDLIEERGGALYGYEFKWSKSKTRSAPTEWTRAYPDAKFETITQENYIAFIA